MNFPLLEIKGVSECFIIRRLNRFVVEVEWKGRRVKAYITNTGRLEEFIRYGRRGFCIPGGRKTECRLFAVEDLGKGAIIDTALQMEAFEGAIEFLPWLEGWRLVRRNVKFGGSVIDYLFEREGRPLYLEVKSAVLRSYDGYAMYPDCPTERGKRHIRELIRLAEKGIESGIVFIAALPEVGGFRPYDEGDPEVSRLLKGAIAAKVMVKALGMYYEPRDSTVRLYSTDLRVKM